MTKKKTPSTASKPKKKPATKPKAKSVTKPKPNSSSGKKASATKAKGPTVKTVVAKTSKSKSQSTGSKPEKVVKTPQKRQVRRKAKSSEEGERKVREIASQSQPKHSEEKKDTGGFSLSDVRSILSNRSKTEDEPTPTEAKPTTEKDSPKKRSSASKAKASKVKKIQTASIDDILGLSLSAVSQRPIRDEKKVPKELFSYYNDLMDLRASLKGALGERSSETLGASARESSGELSLNSSDAGTETFNRDVALSMVASEQEALEEIEDAIDRIFDGTFGICQETGKPIKKARLKVVPFTRFSLEGQNLFEKRKRRDGEPVSGAFATISDSTMGQDE